MQLQKIGGPAKILEANKVNILEECMTKVRKYDIHGLSAVLTSKMLHFQKDTAT